MAELLRAFRFRVALRRSAAAELGSKRPPVFSESSSRLGTGEFQECSGLELESDVKEYLEGGRNDGVLQRVGRVKVQPIVLKRGMLAAAPGQYVDAELWAWLQGVVAGVRPVRRYDGLVEVLATSQANPAVMARWSFFRGLPTKVAGPTLNAQTGEVAIEELHIAHEGLRLEGP